MSKIQFFVCTTHTDSIATVKRIIEASKPTFEWEMVSAHPTDTAAVKQHLLTCHAIIGDPSIAHLLSSPEKSCPNLKWFQSTFAGIDKFLKMSPPPHGPTGTRPKFAVSRGASLFGPAMAEYIIGTTITTQRHIYQLKQIQSTGASPFGIVEQASTFPLVSQLRVGILGGTGSIGQDIARRFYALGATVVGAGRKERKEGEEWLQKQVESEWDKRLPKASDSFSSFISLEGDDAQHQNKLRAFLKDLDVIVNVLPSTPETHYLLGGRKIDGTDGFTEPLSVCKPSSILVNVGRGTVISEAAVCSALNKGFIRHAILDVFEEEPLPPTSALLKLNPSLITLTPHVSGIPQSADFMESLLNFNIPQFVRGMEKEAKGGKWEWDLRYLVNWEDGY